MLPLVHDGKVGSDRTEQGPPFRRLVHELLEERVREQPYAIAVTCGDVSLTYQAPRRPRQRAGIGAARHLRGRSRHTGRPGADRSEYVLIGMLAVLKAGGAYVPLAPDSPDRRFELILRESQSAVVLTDDRYHARLSELVDAAQLFPRAGHDAGRTDATPSFGTPGATCTRRRARPGAPSPIAR